MAAGEGPGAGVMSAIVSGRYVRMVIMAEAPVAIPDNAVLQAWALAAISFNAQFASQVRQVDVSVLTPSDIADVPGPPPGGKPRLIT